MKYFGTDTTGQIIEQALVTDIIGDFVIEKTVGDSMWIKSGDIKVETLEKLPLSDNINVDFHWLAAYWKGKLIDVFNIPDEYDEWDQKEDRFETRLFSIQKKFFDDCGEVNVASGGADTWGENADVGIIEVARIEVVDGDSILISENIQWGASLGDILENMGGSNSKGYAVQTVSWPGPLKNQDDLPILYRGSGIGTHISKDDAVDDTFDDYDTKWLDLFKFASFIYNAFIYAQATVFESGGNSYLGIDVDICPKINVSAGSTTRPHWKNRVFKKREEQIDGVKLESSVNDVNGDPSFSYTQGDPESDNAFTRDVELGDPAASISGYADTLYLSSGDYDAIDSNYDISFINYLFEGFVEAYYANMISEGHVYEGDIFYNGEDVLDHIAIQTPDGDDIAQINRLKVDKQGNVSIEAIKIA